MLSEWREKECWQQGRSLRYGAILFVVAALISGCSAEVVRFDTPLLGYGDTNTEQSSQPVHMDGSLSDRSSDIDLASSTYRTPPATGPVPVQQVQTEPDRGDTYQPVPPLTQPPSHSNAVGNTYRPESYASQPTAAPDKVTVQSGDTLFKLARRHNVSVAAIKSANGLTSDTIRPGQVLYLSGQDDTAQDYAATADANSTIPPHATEPELPPTNLPGKTYTVRRGDTLHAISRRTGVSVSELKKLNAIRDPRLLRQGQILQLASASEPDNPTPAYSDDRISNSRPTQVETSPGIPIVINPSSQGQRRIADPATTSPSRSTEPNSTADRIAANQPPAAQPNRTEDEVVDAALNFRWPVTGRIVRGFGRRSDGSNNDGINIAVPLGTDIKASEKGTVAYAGNELQGYGNIILLRHANGYVSVYAHADRLLAKRGDIVRRGQVIAQAGKTGSVQQPQLHFELRQGAKPIDPIPYLGRM